MTPARLRELTSALLAQSHALDALLVIQAQLRGLDCSAELLDAVQLEIGRRSVKRVRLAREALGVAPEQTLNDVARMPDIVAAARGVRAVHEVAL